MRDFEREVAFKILGLVADATRGDIRRAARELIKVHHPDVGGSSWCLQRVVWARELLLRDPSARFQRLPSAHFQRRRAA